MRDWLWLAAALVMLTIGIGLQQSGLLDSEEMTEVQQSDCDLRTGRCEVTVDGQSYQLVIEPRDIRVLQPLMISLLLPENPALMPDRVSVEFEGVNMDMGYNRVFLDPAEPGVLRGQGMLPACTAQTMIWKIHLLIKLSAVTHDFQFYLETQNH
jgi:hypothetical protein